MTGDSHMSDRPELRIDPASIISTGAIANVSGAYSVEAAGSVGPVCLQGEGGKVMCRYYLHVASKFKSYADNRGVVLSDLAAAHRCAISVIGNCMRFDTEEQDWRGWHVKIADDTGRTLAVVLFPIARR